MTTLLLVRHGETDWNLERRVQGHADRPLNETGRAQAAALADALAGEELDAVYSSDLSRAYETASIVAERHGLAVTALAGLREKDFGTWEGLREEEIVVRFADARKGPWGDSETPEDLAKRVLEAVREIASAHPAGRVLVVTHGGPVRAMLRHCGAARDGAIANCHVVRVDVEGGVFRAVD